MMSRRETLGLLGASAVTLALTRSAFGETPEASLLSQDQRWLTHLTDGILVDQIDSVPTVDGMPGSSCCALCRSAFTDGGRPPSWSPVVTEHEVGRN